MPPGIGKMFRFPGDFFFFDLRAKALKIQIIITQFNRYRAGKSNDFCC